MIYLYYTQKNSPAVTCKSGLHLGFLIQTSVNEISGLFFVEYFE